MTVAIRNNEISLAEPNRAEIVAHMSTNICRCGTYPRIVRAIERAAQEA